MSSFCRLLSIAGIICGLASALPASEISVPPPVGAGAGALHAPNQQYGPYNTEAAANAKARELQAQGHATIVTNGHRDYNHWYVIVLD